MDFPCVSTVIWGDRREEEKNNEEAFFENDVTKSKGLIH